MTSPSWQLHVPISAVVFDCDSTASTLEGIDYLARDNGVGETVQAITADAMGKTGLNALLYQKRLDLVFPSHDQVLALGHQYFAHCVPDISDIINLLIRLNKSIYMISAGLQPAVAIFGGLLQLPQENIYAVNIQFNEEGHFLDFERTSPLINNDGKRVIIMQIKQKHQNIIHIGDGLNDWVTHDIVTRFIGYGGVFYRENIAALCDYYINTLSLAPLLPLSLTQQEVETLTPNEQLLFQKGLKAIHTGLVKV